MSLDVRTSARTRWPRRRASSAAWLPTSPVAPVMKIVLGPEPVVVMSMSSCLASVSPRTQMGSSLPARARKSTALTLPSGRVEWLAESPRRACPRQGAGAHPDQLREHDRPRSRYC